VAPEPADLPRRRRPRAVRLGIPALIVATLAFIALWRVGAPVTPAGGVPAAPPAPLAPLTQLAEVLTDNSIGRRASLENVRIREIPSARTLWIGGDDDRVFVVLDPDVKKSHEAVMVVEGRVTLIGLVRPSPTADVAIRQWRVDPATAQTVEEGGTYLHVTEVRPAAGP
jgi:hypothetical protein